jgi:hypothetical protein
MPILLLHSPALPLYLRTLKSVKIAKGKDPMTAKWGICGLLLAMLFLSAGCRTKQPNLKPDTTAEQFIEPQPGTYMSPSLPKRAFDTVADPGRAALDPKGLGSMPSRGSMMNGAGMGGMGSGMGR